MKKALGIIGLLGGMALSSLGQMTNVQVETHSIRLEWKAFPGNPYHVFSTPDLIGSAWSNLTPNGVAFLDAQGFYVSPMENQRKFYYAMASDYLAVNLAEGPDATNYPVSYMDVAPEYGWTDEYKTTMLVLRRIPAGNFTMGSPTNELGRKTNEPPHAVKLTKDYYVGVFEVTQKQWERVMGDWPSYFSNATCRESRPVEEVCYDDIRGVVAGRNWPADGNVDTNSFMGRLRMKTGQAFDLPTEAQWERACRSGTSTALNSGFDLTSTNSCVHMDAVGRYWYNGGSTYTATGTTAVGTAKVGSYSPSPWGLYDMHGNVWEWCLDWYEACPLGPIDPVGPVSGGIHTARMLRGGSWFRAACSDRSANRGSYYSSSRWNHFGFRVSLPSGQ